MNIFSENNEFERAAVFRDRIQSLRQVRLKQFVSDFSENDADIIAIEEKEGVFCVNLVMIRNSKHLGDKSFFPKGLAVNKDNNIGFKASDVFFTKFNILKNAVKIR